MGISVQDITIVVPTRDRKDRVGTLLSTLEHPHDRVIVVVDEGREKVDLPDQLNGQCVVKCKPDCGAVRAAEAGIEAAKTSHVLLLNDDLEMEKDCLPNLLAFYNDNFPNSDGIVGLNHGPEYAHIACFALMPREFYMEHCYPTPFRRYCTDNELTEKAKMFGRYARCETARVKHEFPPHQEPDHSRDWNLFVPRMQKFADEIRASLPPMKNSVFIAVPIFNSVDVHFFDSMMKFVKADSGLNCKLAVVAGDSLVPRARNTLTMEFLKSDCSHLLFIDSDLIFGADQVARILSHDEDIVGGFYPKKQQGEPELVFNCLTPPAPMDERRLTPVKYIGTGFICVKRRVFEKMIEEYGDDLMFAVDGKPGKIAFDFWSVGVYKYKDGSSRYLSEDWYFCQRAIDLGFTIYGDNGIILKHSGHAIYPLATQEDKLFKRLPTSGAATAAVSPASPLVEAAATSSP